MHRLHLRYIVRVSILTSMAVQVGALFPDHAQAQEQSDPRSSAELLAVAEQYKAASQWDEALDALRAVAGRGETEPAHAALAQARIGQYLLFMALPQDAEVELRKVQEHFPEQREEIGWSRVFLIDALAFQGREDDAIAEAQALIVTPDATLKQLAWARAKLGGLLRSKGRYGEAFEVLEPVTRMGLTDAGPVLDASLNLGRISLEWAMPERAIEAFEFVASHPSATDADRNWARVNLMYACFNGNRMEDIPELANQILWETLFLGEGYEGRRQRELAAWANYWLGRYHEQKMSDARAIGAAEEASVHQEQAALRYAEATSVGGVPQAGLATERQLGEMHLSIGNHAQARDIFASAAAHADELKMAADSVEARLGQARALRGLGRPVEAQALCLEADLLAASSPFLSHKTAFQLAELAMDGKNDEAARAYFERANTDGVAAHVVGYSLDQTRLELAKMADAEGRFDEAIAWNRLVVGNPAAMNDMKQTADKAIAGLYRKQGMTSQEEQWRKYLVAPKENADPTEPSTARAFGQSPAFLLPEEVDRPAARRTALAEFYYELDRLNEAEAAFQQALSEGETDRERADALYGLVKVKASRGKAQRKAGDWDAARASFAEARSLAAQAVDVCLQVALHGPRGEAHHANEQALYGWERLPDYEQALATAERFVAELPPDADVSKIAFAHYMRMRALAWNQRYPEAADAGHGLVGQFAPHADDPAVRTISAAALIRTAAYHARAGDPAAGLDLLNTVENAYPDRFADWVALSRRWISQMLENGEGGS